MWGLAPRLTLVHHEMGVSMRSGQRAPESYWKRNVRAVVGLCLLWLGLSIAFNPLAIEPTQMLLGVESHLDTWWSQQAGILAYLSLLLVVSIGLERWDHLLRTRDALSASSG